MSNVIEQFSRFAHHYNEHNVIQAKVAKALVSTVPNIEYKNILDIGCGSGEVFKNLQQYNISFQKLTVLDSSSSMLDIHPSHATITKIHTDFNNKDFLNTLPTQHYDIVLSSSALQWSNNLDFTLEKLAMLSNTLHSAIFTSGTFKTLHQLADITSPIYTAKTVQQKILKYYSNVTFTVHHYTLSFDSTREMFRYIKKSGVSGGEKKLSYKQTKYLMETYPLEYLEFEVLFVKAKN
jgi:malonyl-CoA O-methyltransferase